MNVALITIARNENLYITEWLEYHLSLGFDKIIIADNDDELLLSGVVSDKVIVEDFTGVSPVQAPAYTTLFKKYRNDYDWIGFWDVDEFLVLEKDKTVQEYLKGFPQQTEMVRLNCKHFTDGEKLDIEDDYKVFERFTEAVEVDEDRYTKNFVSGRIRIKEPWIAAHSIFRQGPINSVDALGNPSPIKDKKTETALHKGAWINHYRTKTIGEYIRQKMYRGGPNKNPQRYSNWEKYFFVTNTRTEEKVEYAKRIIKKMGRTNIIWQS